jgi:hypothetical protein
LGLLYDVLTFANRICLQNMAIKVHQKVNIQTKAIATLPASTKAKPLAVVKRSIEFLEGYVDIEGSIWFVALTQLQSRDVFWHLSMNH